MLFYQIIVTVFMCFICFKTSSSCSPDKDRYNSILCSSFEELTKAGNHPEWHYLTIKNSGSEPLQTLKNNAFKNVPNLRLLILDGIINKFENSVFKELKELVHLELLNNDISELPDKTISELNLNYFAIINSKLKSIPANYFTKMNNLEFLDMRNNLISTIGDCAFCNLKTTYIFLAVNNLRTFEPVRVLGPTSLILGLNIDENNLTTVPLFGKMPNLKEISLINNSIETFEEGSLRNAPDLILFDISFNKVKNIPSNAFPDSFNRKEHAFLLLHNNNIECIPKEIRDKIKKLRRLTVNDNPWNCECLQVVKQWAKNKNAYIGCDFRDICEVPCINNQNIKETISFNYT